MRGPVEAYRAGVESGVLEFDEGQAQAAEVLEVLHRRLSGYDPSLRARLSELLRARSREPQPKGLYLFGGVGRGKSMLMDAFFASAPVAAKRRVHFNAFMLEIHEAIGAWRKLSESERRAQPHFVKGAGDDPMPPVAEMVAETAMLLCFDEFQVEDIADAMILSRLFKELFERGVIVVATSNQAPNDLYKDGLNRQLFLPFVALLKERLDILEIDSGIDYRLRRLVGSPVYHIATGVAAQAVMDVAWERLTDSSEGESFTLEVQGRKFMLQRTARGVARLSFDALCREARGPADYLALAQAFHVVMIDRIPRLGAAERNEARRFITLIDALYERKVKVICSAEAPPRDIYAGGDGAVAFERTVSRLIEMQSADYMAARHLGA